MCENRLLNYRSFILKAHDKFRVPSELISIDVILCKITFFVIIVQCTIHLYISKNTVHTTYRY